VFLHRKKEKTNRKNKEANLDDQHIHSEATSQIFVSKKENNNNNP